jgi:hypothetical protein
MFLEKASFRLQSASGGIFILSAMNACIINKPFRFRRLKKSGSTFLRRANEKRTLGCVIIIAAFLVPRAGIEPARCHHRGILSPVRLPIPPSRQRSRHYL